MSVIQIRQGTVQTTTKLPKLVDKYPHLVDPLKLQVHDSFTKTGRANLGGSSPDLAKSGQVWSAGTGFTCTPGSDGGYVSGAANQQISAAAVNMKVFGAIEYGASASGLAGICARMTDTNNMYRLSIGPTGLVFNVWVAGGSTSLYQNASIVPVAGQDYLLGLRLSGDSWTVSCATIAGGVLSNLALASGTYATPAALAAVTNAGLHNVFAAHRYKSFACGGA